MNEVADWNGKNEIKYDGYDHTFQCEHESLFHM